MEEEKNTNRDLLQLVSFRLGNEEFGVDIIKVQEIIRKPDITDVPNSPAFVEGVINLRGKVISVIDLRTKLGMPKTEHGSSTRIVVVEINECTLGFIVDNVSEVLRISKDITEPPPAFVAGISNDYITAVGKLKDRLIILLDLDRILVTTNISSLKEAV